MTTKSQRENSAFVGAGLAYTTREEEMAAFDALPEPLRLAVNETATKLAATTILRHLGWALRRFDRVDDAVAATARKLAELEAGEISVMAGRYEALKRGPYPHVAAAATILRYGPLGRAKNRRTGRSRGIRKLQIEGLAA